MLGDYGDSNFKKGVGLKHSSLCYMIIYLIEIVKIPSYAVIFGYNLYFYFYYIYLISDMSSISYIFKYHGEDQIDFLNYAAHEMHIFWLICESN